MRLLKYALAAAALSAATPALAVDAPAIEMIAPADQLAVTVLHRPAQTHPTSPLQRCGGIWGCNWQNFE